MRRTLPGIFALCLLALAACDDSDKSFSPISQDAREYGISIARFPHSVGDSWTYTLRDSSYQDVVTVDTFVVTIVDSIGYDCGLQDCSDAYAQIWRLDYSDDVDTLFVIFNQDSVYGAYGYVRVSLLFPLELNKTWEDTLGLLDIESQVTSVTTIELDGKSVVGCFVITSTTALLGSVYYSTAIIAPDIGITSLDIRRVLTTQEPLENRYTWDLLDWDLQ